MTAYISLARDIGIALALGFIVWKIYGAGENAVKVNDIAALKTQLDDNSKTLARWAQESRDAQIQRAQQMDTVFAAVNAQRAPIVLLRDRPASPSPVPSAPAAAASPTTQAGGFDAGAGIDLRPQINRFEIKYEAAIADCRAVLAQWPN